MKTTILMACALSAAAATLHADNLVANGDFETGTGNAFYQCPPWYNRGAGFNQGTGARSNAGAVISGEYSATVIDRYKTAEGKFGPLAYTQKTQHAIREGDSFTLSYRWRPADKFWQKSRDTVRFVLYATANDHPGGTVVWSSEFTSVFYHRNDESPMTVSETTEEVSSDAVGRILFVMFYGLDTSDSETGEPHWARVDDIEVKALNSKPAP